MALFAHEARHNEGLPHTCGTFNDQTISELGAWGIEHYLFEWMAFRSGQYMFPKDYGAAPSQYRAWVWTAAQSMGSY